MTPPGDGGMAPRRRSAAPLWPALPLLLAVLAVWDLRDDLLLLLDRPTFTAGFYLLRSHPLAVLVLLLQPSLWRRYRSG
jgi:hypothetical protein